MRIKILLSLLLFSVGVAQAQEEEINVAGLVYLNYGGDMPTDLLGSKAIVLVGTPANPNESIRQDWKPLVDEAHPVFYEAGIDAVGYYFYEDVIAGPEARIAFAKTWNKREIKYIIVLSKVEVSIKKKPGIRYVVMITEYNKLPSIMNDGQSAWKAQGKALDKVLDKVTKNAARLTNNAMLTSSSPEYFYDAPMIKGQHVETYFTDLDFGKMAVPKFPIAEIPANKPGGVINNQVEKQAEFANGQASTYNKELETLMKGYKFAYEFTDPALTDADLMTQGFMYVMYKLHTSGKEIKRLLDFSVSDDDEMYTTVRLANGKPAFRYIPADAPVYKYYIKHLKTGNVYLGKNWDADEGWQDALKNCLYGISQEKTR